MGSAPEQAELEGWSSKLKVRPTLGAARSGRAPCRVEAALTQRMNGLTWLLVGSACEPPSRAATAWCTGAM